ncbi:ZZ type zinc finger domain protein [Aspergillus clavatus NRRL 1]|uniref:ZZ type zinc finger domain protein n=1 Tax=Aspergillus clavatus (strain ATCC 1007 / CBS 513.65 / DSM 816 / NCTC 3887 / NRRL 1 / QM 1276 / 107) TaxID=344612 RepID=A1CJ52_ASPCL|nr:ZZ type zinc finger domain protein [Aspergillus clavatus NRRL 1]EAW09176.1 ZZ type zinc finger domain protein [Aspergillus clavatus NRRL 1]
MSTTLPPANPVGPATLITVKVLLNDSTRRFKVPLRDLGARVLPQKLHQLLSIPADSNVIFERYSDSAGCYVRLDSENQAVYKQVYRAAKAKLKLRIKATVVDEVNEPVSQPSMSEDAAEEPSPARYSYLETVLSSPTPAVQAEIVPTAISESVPNLSAEPVPDTSAGPQSVQWTKDDDAVPAPLRYRDFVLNPDSVDVPIVSHRSPTGVFCIDCNHCGRSIPNEHFHCSICDDGDYDLCPQCVTSGVSCQAEDHWLIKRFVDDGVVTNSTTEKVAPRKLQEVEEVKTASEILPELVPEKDPEPSVAPVEDHSLHSVERICNSCLKDFDETKMVTCTDCDDYDLCMTCLLKDAHGHHPAHRFSLLNDGDFCLKSLVESRCNPGRHHQHAAICDGCDKRIVGVRHKCLTCPDWDYCSNCVANSSQSHPGHRFVPLYEAISEPLQYHEVHYGIYCDGPLCQDKPCPGYITGVRYKCSVCHDTDFCAKCEALPTNTHNRTHPMLMLKTPVRSLTICNSVTENGRNGPVVVTGDRIQRSTSTQINTSLEAEKSTEIPCDLEEVAAEEAQTAEPSKPAPEEKQAKVYEMPTTDPASSYQALFIRDTTHDGTVMSPNKIFLQTWTLYNPGPLAWPAGSDVRFVGGDSMFNVDTNRPLSLDSISAAMESNKLLEPLEPGQRADFTVTLKAPSRVGTAISYWRLKLPNGMPFGHRLWCDIQVREEEPLSTELASVKPTAPEDDQKSEVAEVDGSEPMGSRMIFPTLDKESPVSSTHQGMNPVPRAPSVTNPSEQDILEDVESLTLEDDQTEAGFLTDEEYDVLDASDQDYLEAQQSQH